MVMHSSGSEEFEANKQAVAGDLDAELAANKMAPSSANTINNKLAIVNN